MKGMHLTLDSWHPYRNPKGWKQEPDGLDIDIPQDNQGGEAEKYLVQITGTPRKGAAIEKGEPKMVRASQRWFL